jgi:tetratricopeptide (TPR) repeat protein
MSNRSTLSRSLLGLSLLLPLSLSAFAQVSDKENTEKEAERKQQIERKTYVLVDEIAGAAPGLKLPENRSFVLAAAADLLWEHDEPRARNLFWDALNTLNLMNSSSQVVKGAKPSAKEKEQNFNEYSAVFALRQQLLQRVARHDPQLALDMLRSSRQAPFEPVAWMRDGFALPDDRSLEQQIATEVAARDPQKALQLARESLAKGFTYQLIMLLQRLNQKDAEIGTKFAGEIINKLRSRNIATDLPGSSIAVSLLTISRPPTGPATSKLTTATGNWRLKLDEEQRRELVDLITNAALTESGNANLLYALSEIMPEIKEFAPERLALVQKKLAAFNQTLSKGERLSDEYNSLTRNGTPEEVLKLADTVSENERAWMQQQAVVMAAMHGRADSLREYINSEITDESRRKSLLEALDTQQINIAIDKNDTEELQKLLPKIRQKEVRARVMSELAITLEQKGDHDEALSLLNEAQTLIKTGFENESQSNALLALVGAYAQVEPAKAFGIIERTVDRANDEMTKLLLLDKFISTGIIKKGEISMQHSGMIPIDFAVFKYGKSVAALASADFERTRAAADRFERNELRLMARLLLAQALLRHDDQAIPNGTQ